MRKIRLIVVSMAVIITLVIFGFTWFAREPSSVQKLSAPEELPLEELPTEEIPPNLLVIPEVPLGTIAILLACFFAFIIIQMKPKAKLR